MMAINGYEYYPEQQEYHAPPPPPRPEDLPRYLRLADVIGKNCVGIEQKDDEIFLYFAGGICLRISGYAYDDEDTEINGVTATQIYNEDTTQMEAKVGKHRDFAEFLVGRYNGKEPQPIREWRV